MNSLGTFPCPDTLLFSFNHKIENSPSTPYPVQSKKEDPPGFPDIESFVCKMHIKQWEKHKIDSFSCKFHRRGRIWTILPVFLIYFLFYTAILQAFSLLPLGIARLFMARNHTALRGKCATKKGKVFILFSSILACVYWSGRIVLVELPGEKNVVLYLFFFGGMRIISYSS